MKPTIWNGCYDQQWTGLITPESFAHPAKMARVLLERIIRHGLDRGYWSAGQTIGDCFGGVGTTGIVGAYHGLRVVSVELEKRFVSMARRNYALHGSKWKRLGVPRPVILQGDSRRFDEIVLPIVAMVSSPPYNLPMSQDHNGSRGGTRGTTQVEKGAFAAYGSTPGQIETLPCGELAAVLSSPPWQDNAEGSRKAHMGGVDKILACNRGHGASDAAVLAQAARDEQKVYGNSPGQIGKLKCGSVDAVISSPPYAEGLAKASQYRDPSKAAKDSERDIMRSKAGRAADVQYGATEGQIGKLRGGNLQAVVSSPPYETNVIHGGHGLKLDKFKDPSRVGLTSHAIGKNEMQRYGQTEGNIGNGGKESYWQAMALVYAACFRAIRPGGVLVLVTKDYVKNRKRVLLSDDTVTLCEHTGFELIERARAMLVAHDRHADLFDGENVKTKSRKSFFRRLAEKNGSPSIDWEDVLIFRKLGA